MLATAAAEPFDSRDHLFEVLWDGIRAIVFVDDGDVTVRSRDGDDLTAAFPELQKLAGRIKGRRAILDGEIVSFAKDGKPSFARLLQRLNRPPAGVPGARRPVKINYQVFDILHLDGETLFDLPLIDRKQVLLDHLSPSRLAQSIDFIVIDGVDYFQAISNLGLGGMVAKRMTSRYRPGERIADWEKIKVARSSHFVVGGYTFGGGYRSPYVGALLLGLYDECGAFRYVGEVGGGFGEQTLKQIRPMLDGQTVAESPFADPPRIERFSFWCEPTVVCKVRYAEVTEAGRLRFPIFDSLRPVVGAPNCTFAALDDAPVAD